jgi:hypothetical protein
MHGMSHDGLVLFGVWLLRVTSVMSVKHHVTGGDSSVSLRACGALLWRFVLRSSMCLFEQHENRCRRGLFSLMLHRLHRLYRLHRSHSGEMSCLYTHFLAFITHVLIIMEFENL